MRLTDRGILIAVVCAIVLARLGGLHAHLCFEGDVPVASAQTLLHSPEGTEDFCEHDGGCGGIEVDPAGLFKVAKLSLQDFHGAVLHAFVRAGPAEPDAGLLLPPTIETSSVPRFGRELRPPSRAPPA